MAPEFSHKSSSDFLPISSQNTGAVNLTAHLLFVVIQSKLLFYRNVSGKLNSGSGGHSSRFDDRRWTGATKKVFFCSRNEKRFESEKMDSFKIVRIFFRVCEEEKKLDCDDELIELKILHLRKKSVIARIKREIGSVWGGRLKWVCDERPRYKVLVWTINTSKKDKESLSSRERECYLWVCEREREW